MRRSPRPRARAQHSLPSRLWTAVLLAAGAAAAAGVAARALDGDGRRDGGRDRAGRSHASPAVAVRPPVVPAPTLAHRRTTWSIAAAIAACIAVALGALAEHHPVEPWTTAAAPGRTGATVAAPATARPPGTVPAAAERSPRTPQDGTGGAPAGAPGTTIDHGTGAGHGDPPATAEVPGAGGPGAATLATRALAGVGGRRNGGALPMRSGALPVGKGMWIYQPHRTDGGDVGRIVQRAVDVGLTHVYVRTGSSWMGFYAQAFLDRLLPVAHAAGIRVYGWDFPNLESWQVDVARAAAAIRYTTPDGHRIDGFAADIETAREGTRLSPEAALAYGTGLRQWVGYGYPLIACVPRAGNFATTSYPYPHVVAQFDAIAPMVYWMHRDPGADVARTIEYLAQFGKPVLPVGQAYDGAADGGRPGVPGRNEVLRFMEVAEQKGAPGVSFWSWEAASQESWDAVRDASQFVVPLHRANQTGGRNILVQTLLTSLGFPTRATGDWDPPTVAALRSYQRAAGLAPTGELDGDTRHALLTPFAPPIRPMFG